MVNVVLVGCDPEVEDFCTENAICSENPDESHFDCYCLPGYVGNGYELCEGRRFSFTHTYIAESSR